MTPTTLIRLILLLTLATAAFAQSEAVTEPSADLELGFTVAGRVAEVLVEPGDAVESGQLLVRLDDRIGEAQVELSRIRAESDIAVKLARAELELAQKRESRVRDALGIGAAEPSELEEAVLESTRAALRVEMAEQQQQEFRRQLQLAELGRERFELRAPRSGLIEDVNAATGELLDELEPVIRLVAIDPLRLDAAISTARTLELSVGDEVFVTHELKPDSPVRGRIVQLGAVADAGSGTRRVRIEAPNPDSLPAGGVVTVTLPDDARSDASQRRLWNWLLRLAPDHHARKSDA